MLRKVFTKRFFLCVFAAAVAQLFLTLTVMTYIFKLMVGEN